MREIKFRAWDKLNNKWIYADVLRLGRYEDLIDSQKVCQYTDLKDKNGKEIYEGDFISSKENEYILKVVYWSSGYFAQVANGEKNTIYDMPLLGELNLELYGVVGNIYETPELCGRIQ